jgi:hypothetical protein
VRGPGLVADDEQAVEGPAGPIPLRSKHSIRRTATLDMSWPEGVTGPMQLVGRARDAITRDPTEPPTLVQSASMEAVLRDRVIESIATEPNFPGISELVGQRGGGHLRGALAKLVPEVRGSGSPLYLLLDDISGTSLIGGVAWTRRIDAAQMLKSGGKGSMPNMEGVCIGFAPGSSALVELGEHIGPVRVQPIGKLGHPDDPHGWHDLPALPEISTRRARFIDVHLDEGEAHSAPIAHIESGFQDSTNDPDHGRIGFHEYRLRATVDLTTGRLETLEPTPHILPFRECPSAVATARSIIGSPVTTLRDVVLDRLAKTNGCTHLNDALRALAEVPVLLEAISGRLRH